MSYEPFKNGPSVGSIQACRHCGVKPANGHTLTQSGQCDWARKPAAEKAKILAARAAKEVAA